MRFLDGPSLENAIRDLLPNARQVRVAVAYWGDGAIERVGLDRLTTTDVEIVCDLRSGACNPTEVRRLQEAIGKENVKRCERLHGKVWLIDQAAIVGSSNASANGFGWEGDETKGLVEANLLVDDAEILKCVQVWFQTLNSSSITSKDLRQAEQLWKKRRISRPIVDNNSLAEIVQNDPSAVKDRNIFVWAKHWVDLDPWAKHLLKEQTNQLGDQNLDCYQGYYAPAGAQILEFNVQRNGRCRFNGAVEIISNKIAGPTALEDDFIILCRDLDLVCGHELGPQEIWEEAVTEAVATTLSHEWFQPLEELAQFFPRVP
jgi:hypothetical protein